MVKYIFAPGCALMSYKPQLAERLKDLAIAYYGEMDTLLKCCFNAPKLDNETVVVTPCATCAESYSKGYKSIFLLEEMARWDDFPFPDYGGVEMSIQDTCTARSYPQYLEGIRTLLDRMNIRLVEPKRSGKNAKCCGQTFYGKLAVEKVEEQMRLRAGEMPCEEVVVYCASCIMSMAVGGRKPRYIIDLLYNVPTEMTLGVDGWNGRLKAFRDSH